METRLLRLMTLLGMWILSVCLPTTSSYAASSSQPSDKTSYLIITPSSSDGLDHNQLQEHFEFGQHRLRNKITSHHTYQQALEQLEEFSVGKELIKPVRLLHRMASLFASMPPVFSKVFCGRVTDRHTYDLPFLHLYIVFEDFRI